MNQNGSILVASSLAASLAFSASGCGNGEDAAGILIETRADGVVVVHNPDRGIWGTKDTPQIQESTRIGKLEGPDPYVFGNIRDVSVSPDGWVYVLDDRTRQVRIFDSNGLHLRSAGRQGQGPGEFQMPIGLTWAPDGNLWVVDVASSRYTVLTPAGDYLNTYRREITGFSATWGGTFDASGVLYEPGASVDPVTGQSKRVLVSQALDDNRLVETARFEIPNDIAPYYQVSFQGGSMNLAIPYAPRPTWVFDGESGVWVATGEHYRFWHQSLNGRTTRVVELAREPEVVSDSERSEAREGIERQLRRIAGGADQVDFSKIPSHKPAHGPILLDDSGRIWVVQTPPALLSEEDGTPPRLFDVFDPEGRYLGPLSIKIELQPLPVIRANRIVGIIREVTGLQRVVVYEIR